MFKRTDDKISTSQATIVLTNSMLGAGILTMPKSVVKAVQTPDAWLSVALGGIVVFMVIMVMVKLSQQFPGKTVFQYSKKIVGNFPGSVLSSLLILYFIVIAGFEIRVLAEVTLFFLLEGTPIWAIVMPFIWVGTYLVYGGINAIARVFQIVFPISIFILIICFILSSRIFDIHHLRPLLSEGMMPVIRGMKSSILIFTGCEVVMTMTAFMQHPQEAVKAMTVGLCIPLVLYLVTIVMVIGGLSINSVITSTWPTIDLVRSFEISGFFFERFEFPLLVIWLMQMFCNFCSFFFNASLGISQVFNVKIHPVMIALMPIIFICTMIPQRLNDVLKLGDSIGYMGVMIFVLLPVLLSIVLLIRKKGLKQNV
ncbi:spore germination protein [Paenibacillus sp. PastF-3]|uniref:GerAB/ArcD/ProY family transporter n=1 Tax=unclassified Paenibacillus TaxID=185978 RepID=UPI000B9FB9A8|nr:MULTISPECIES: GerAB/ArcD/ProY family transporter [unclassified Paenibacillus]MDH6368946.1 spore germination protein [Paenibacillus sp. PastF-3]OZQ97510.1 spore gernimation protein [Paenibacillus sp. VTT E-133291]